MLPCRKGCGAGRDGVRLCGDCSQQASHNRVPAGCGDPCWVVGMPLPGSCWGDWWERGALGTVDVASDTSCHFVLFQQGSHNQDSQKRSPTHAGVSRLPKLYGRGRGNREEMEKMPVMCNDPLMLSLALSQHIWELDEPIKPTPIKSA